MSRPRSTKLAGINEKLEFAELERHRLNDSIMGSYKPGGPLPKFVAMKAETILANARECFDHLGMDLIDCHLTGKLKPSFLQKLQAGKLRTYFPMYSGQLTADQFAFRHFKETDAAIYEELKAFVTSIETGAPIPGTMFHYSDFRVVQEMVNEKKHAKVTEYAALPNKKIYSKGSVGEVVIDKDRTKLPPGWTIDFGPGFLDQHSPTNVPGYVFTANGRDVLDLCLFATRATALVMRHFYGNLFDDGNVTDLDLVTLDGSAQH